MLWGGAGHDLLTGGVAGDIFVFVAAAQMGRAAAHDRVVDFAATEDRLDLSSLAAGQVFIGGDAFSGVTGQIRYVAASGLLMGDLDGNGRADYVLEL